MKTEPCDACFSEKICSSLAVVRYALQHKIDLSRRFIHVSLDGITVINSSNALMMQPLLKLSPNFCHDDLATYVTQGMIIEMLFHLQP